MDRQVRTFQTQFRAGETDGTPYIEGYFAVYGDVYQLWSGATESIAPGAFDDQLDCDVRALINHDTTLVLGRTKFGTLQLRVDTKGLWGHVDINPRDSDAMNLYARVQRRDVDQCSFGFDILNEDTEQRSDGTIHWTIRKVKLYEVSPVTFPAYEATTLSARKREAATMQTRRVEALRMDLRERLKRHVCT